MKTINEYLLTKSSRRSVNGMFPEECDKDLIENFLQEHGFKKHNDTGTGFSIAASETKDPLYAVGENLGNLIIRFSEGGSTGYDKAFVLMMPNSNIYRIDSKNYNESWSSYKEFVKGITEYFGW